MKDQNGQPAVHQWLRDGDFPKGLRPRVETVTQFVAEAEFVECRSKDQIWGETRNRPKLPEGMILPSGMAVKVEHKKREWTY